MRNLVKLCCKGLILATIGLGSTAVSAQGLKVDRFFIVGDSLSDGGAYSTIAKLGIETATGNPAPNIFYKFTENNIDGSSKVWADVVAETYGIALTPNIVNGVTVDHDNDPNTPDLIVAAPIETNGTNYAQGGSRVTERSISANSDPNDPTNAFNVTAIPVVLQVDRLLDDVGGKFRKNDLVAVWAGANDVFAQSLEPQSEVVGNLLGAVTDLNGQIKRLQDAGARNIIIMTIPVGTTAASPGDELFQIYNSALKDSRNGKDGVVVDFSRLIDATALDPIRYGFTSPNALTQPSCLPPGSSSLTCLNGITTVNDGTHTRADAVHPSQQSHQNIGDVVLGTLRAASQSSIIVTSSLSTLRQHSLSLESRLSPSAFDGEGKNGKRPVGDIQAFANAEGGFFENDGGANDPSSDISTQSLRIGGDVIVSKNALVGLSVSFTRAEADFDENHGGFDSRTIIGSLYANVNLTKSTFVNAVIGAGHIDLNDVTRKFNIGPSAETFKGETDGDYFHARVGAGYVLPFGGWSVTPGVAYSYEKVKINGYTEDLGVASLSFGDNELESSRITASLTATYNPKDPNGWTPTFRVSLEHELEDSALKVHLGPDSGTIGALYIDRPDGTYGYLSAGVSKKIGESSSFGVNATTVIGQDGVTGVSGGISFKSKF